MNKILTENCVYGFPGNKRFLDFLQEELVPDHWRALADCVFGTDSSFILSGCEVTGTGRIAPGFVSVQGLVVRFSGGSPMPYVNVQEVEETAVFHDGLRRGAFRVFTAGFSDRPSGIVSVTWAQLQFRAVVEGSAVCGFGSVHAVYNSLNYCYRFNKLLRLWGKIWYSGGVTDRSWMQIGALEAPFGIIDGGLYFQGILDLGSSACDVYFKIDENKNIWGYVNAPLIGNVEGIVSFDAELMNPWGVRN